MSSHFHFDIGGASLIEVNVPDKSALMDQVGSRIRNRNGFALATINLDHLVKLRTSDRFRQAYSAQDMVVADGNPIVWLSRMARRPMELAPGSDLVIPLAQLAAKHEVPIALLGATATVLEAAANRLRQEVPGLQVTACLAPSQNFDPDGHSARRRPFVRPKRK